MKPANKSLTRSTSDPLHDLQLLKDLQIINERTVKELGPLPPGGLPVQKKRKPKPWNSDAFESTNLGNENEEDETMKLTQIATMAALAIGTAACNPAASVANANTASTEHAAQTSKAAGSSANAHAPRLGPEYKKINSFFAFRKKLLTDGWHPVANPHCIEALVGTLINDEDCSKSPNNNACRTCKLVPEIFVSTTNGYNTMQYIKNGTPLTVTTYGDFLDLDAPDKELTAIITWDYTAIKD